VDNRELALEVLPEIEKISVIDSHEHLYPEGERVARDTDVLEMIDMYVIGDLHAAGCPPEVAQKIVDPKVEIAPRWQLLEPYWPKIRNGSYARMWTRTLKDLFGCEEMSAAALAEATEKMRQANQPGWYEQVLKERCNIAISVLDDSDVGTACDRELFVPVIRATQFIEARTKQQLEELSANTDHAIHSLDDLVSAAQSHISQAHAEGAVGLKVSHAYRRTLQHDKVTYAEAEQLFNRIFDHLGEGLSWAEAKPLQDYMLHKCVQAAMENDMTIIFHTGIQAGGNNIVTNTNPTLLTNLFLEYKQARFDLFHAGYPYARECGVLAKYFSNVWVDLAWMHIISAAGTRQILRDWLDLIPANKIIGFGGDVRHVELVYGHLYEARRNIAQVLAERVEHGDDTMDEAIRIAQFLLHDSPAEAFNLSL